MAQAPEPDLDELLWSIAAARIIFGPAMNIQAPPNLTPGDYGRLIGAGINDWGGVSPVTPDHVNPEAPWPHLEVLRRESAKAGKILTARLPIYPAYYRDAERWVDPAVRPRMLQAADAQGWARDDRWSPGIEASPPGRGAAMIGGFAVSPSREIVSIAARASGGEALSEPEIVTLFGARGGDFDHVIQAADALRARVSGDIVTYAVNRNINYTNICEYKCRFCAFSKGKTHEALRGVPYDLDLAEVGRRAREAWDRGATEVCMQGGIHPDYTGETYIALCRAVKAAAPGLHIHAFSPLEIQQGAATLGLDPAVYLEMLKTAGLGTLPGTAAEILDDEVRRALCPDKLDTQEWLNIVAAAHAVGFRTTATIMFGHIDRPEHWARHLIRIRDLQERTGGFTEFVPLPFVHMEAPLYLKGQARKGPTFRETVLMHAVARLALNPVLPNIQTSWVKLGPEGVRACLQAGANDLGGTLMNESITRAAGAAHGQEMPPETMDALIRSIGRTPRQRTTLYGAVSDERRQAARTAPPLEPMIQTPARRRAAA
jgi:FO synthase